MYRDPFGEFVFGYLGLKGALVVVSLTRPNASKSLICGRSKECFFFVKNQQSVK